MVPRDADSEFRAVDAEPSFKEIPSQDAPHFVWHLDELEPGLPSHLVAHFYTKERPCSIPRIHTSFLSTGDLVSGAKVYCTMDEEADALAFPVLEGGMPRLIVRDVVGQYAAAVDALADSEANL